MSVERPYYADGRRLTAADLRLEQHYQIATRRMLSRGLFTPGVVQGFEVVVADATHVVVAAGLALDPAGREIVLSDEQVVAVPAQPPVSGIGGFFLVARYAEQRIPAADEVCAPGDATGRVRELIELLWTETYPAHDLCDPLRTSIDCAVVLAFAHLTNACEISSVEIGVREYARPTHISQTSAYALEGEKDIDQDNPKILHFHIRGGAPNSVTLFLWGHDFSSTFYTELGRHAHGVAGTIDPKVAGLTSHRHGTQHTHGLPAIGAAGGHAHSILTTSSLDHIGTFPPDVINRRYILKSGFGATPAMDFLSTQPGHTHSLGQATAGADPSTSDNPSALGTPPQHDHVFHGTISPSGNATYAGRNDNPYHYFAELKVELDGTDITPQLVEKLPSTFNKVLGNGQAGHPITGEGAGPLDLLEIASAAGRPIDVGPHTLTFHLDRLAADAPNGGNLHYNLYVE